jgi:acyl carrier protein
MTVKEMGGEPEVERDLNGTVAAIRNAIVTVKGVPVPDVGITLDTPLWTTEGVAANFGLDSLDVLEVILVLEEEYGLVLPDSVELDMNATVRDMARSLVPV